MAADRVHRAARAVAAWVRRGSQGDAVPLGDTHDLERPARRTRLVRLGLAVALVAALLAAVASIPGPPRPALPPGGHRRDGRPRPLVEHQSHDVQADRIRARVAREDRSTGRRRRLLRCRLRGAAAGHAGGRAAVLRRASTPTTDPPRRRRHAVAAQSVGRVVLGRDEHLLGAAARIPAASVSGRSAAA